MKRIMVNIDEMKMVKRNPARVYAMGDSAAGGLL